MKELLKIFIMVVLVIFALSPLWYDCFNEVRSMYPELTFMIMDLQRTKQQNSEKEQEIKKRFRRIEGEFYQQCVLED